MRNCARGLSAPLRWFFHAMRVSTSFISSASTPYFLAYAGASRLNDAGAVTVGAGAVVGRGRHDEAGVAGVLQLLDADGHRHVVGAGGHRVAGVAERLGAGGAEVLDVGDRLVVDLQRPAEREARTGPSPSCRARTRRRRRARCRPTAAPSDDDVDQHVVGRPVPVLAEGRAAHADDGDLVADPV